MRPQLTGILSLILSHNWAMREEAYREMINFVNGFYDPNTLASVMHSSSAEQYSEVFANHEPEGIDWKAIQKQVDADLPGAYRAEYRGNVAIIPVRGPIFPRANIITQWSGGTSISGLANDLNAAVENSEIDTIIQNVDSPGGDIVGTDEYSEMIYKARAAGKKVITYIYGQGASAALWISVPSTKILVSATSMVGSIGVVSGFLLSDEADKKRGIQRVEIVSSQSPKKRMDPRSEEGAKDVQSIVDGLANIFIAKVAKGRNVTTEKVLSDFGRGGMLLAEKALEVGMIDGISSLEDVISTYYKSNSFYTGGFMPVSVAQLKSESPDTYNAVLNEGKVVGRKEAEAETSSKIESVKAEGKLEGAKAENARIKSIEDISIVGAESIIKEKKFDMKETAETVSLAIVNDQKARRDQLKGDRDKSGTITADATKGSVPPPSGAEDTLDAAEEKALLEAMTQGANSVRSNPKGEMQY